VKELTLVDQALTEVCWQFVYTKVTIVKTNVNEYGYLGWWIMKTCRLLAWLIAIRILMLVLGYLHSNIH